MLKCGGVFHWQAQRFVRSAVFCIVTLGLAFGEWCFGDVGCGCDNGICVSGCCIKAYRSRVFVTSLS